MMKTKNICKDFSFQDFTEQWIDKMAHNVSNMGDNAAIMLAFFVGDSLSESNALKKKFAKKNPKKRIDKDLLNTPQTTDKARSRVKIDALLACSN
jgi:hypothetical protein